VTGEALCGGFSKSILPRILQWHINPFMLMRFNKLFSLKYLIALGFAIAVFPLVIAVLYVAFTLRESAELGKAMNYEIFEQTKTIGLVLQKASDLERKARLYVLLIDPSFRQPYERQSYENARASFKQALGGLLKLRLESKVSLLANELSEKEDLIYQQIIELETENNSGLPIDEAFQRFREASNTLSREFESHVDRQFRELSRQSGSLEQSLLVKGAILALISGIFIILTLSFLARSMRQLDASVRRLSAGNLADAIRVSGPPDLRYLGERLEWLRTRLLNLEESKQQFMRNVAGEIEAPLKDIREEVARLADAVDGQQEPSREDIVLSLSAHIEKLQTVSEEVLRYSRIESQPRNAPKETINLKTLLESVVESYETRLKAKSITVKELVGPVEFVGIQEQLKTIIDQLISNAVKYSPVGGEIRIMLRASGNRLEFEVEDEGPGIDPDERAQVFAPFFRGKANQTQEIEGSGLGLAIVREYVANHLGKVDIVEPRLDQHGARVRVQIPLTDES